MALPSQQSKPQCLYLLKNENIWQSFKKRAISPGLFTVSGFQGFLGLGAGYVFQVFNSLYRLFSNLANGPHFPPYRFMCEYGGGGGGVFVEEEGQTGVDIMVLCERLVRRYGTAFRKSQRLYQMYCWHKQPGL